MKEQCPRCQNIVAGEFSPSGTRKWLTALAKKGGMKAVLTAAGSVVPGFGNVAGFIAGTALDVIYGNDINKLVDEVADLFDDNKVYVFECPNCGHTWTRKEDEFTEEYETNNDFEHEEENCEMAGQFNQSLSYLLNETEQVIDSVSTVEAFMRKMNGYASQSQYDLCAAFHFLASFSGLLFVKDTHASKEDKRDVSIRAISQIQQAISFQKLDEYKLIDCLLRIQMGDNIDNLLQSIRVATACKVGNDSWLKKKYYSESLIPDICFYKLLNIDGDKTVRDEDKANLWKTLVNSPVKDYRMYANLRVYIRLSDYDKSADRYLCSAYHAKGFSLNKPDMESPIYAQWLWAALDYSERLRLGNSEYIDKNESEGVKMLHTIADLGNATACLSARYSLGQLAEGNGNLQDALKYYIRAGEQGAKDSIRVRKMILNNSSKSVQTSTTSKPENSIQSDDESEYLAEIRTCLEDGGEISKGERRLLDKLRVKLGISEARAAELEQSLIAIQLTDEEQEYLAEYRECYAEDGGISTGERRLLNRLRDKLGISEERASELEKL